MIDHQVRAECSFLQNKILPFEFRSVFERLHQASKSMLIQEHKSTINERLATEPEVVAF